MRRRGFSFDRASTNPTMPSPLRHAHEQMELGDYARVALTFEELALAAENRAGPRAIPIHSSWSRARPAHPLPLLRQPGAG